MTTKFVADLDRAASAFLEKSGSGDENDKQRARVAYLMAEANKNRAKAETEEMFSALMEDRETRTPSQHHSATMTMMDKDASGKYVARTIFFAEPTEAVLALMVSRPVIFTGLVWNGLSMSERLELLETAKQDQSLMVASSVLEVLPPATLDFILGWQKAINSGDAWLSSNSVCEAGEWMVSCGYCLSGKISTQNDFAMKPSRDELQPGKPGTPAFVKAMMGEAYLVWLLQQDALAD